MASPRRKATPKAPQSNLGKALDFVKHAQVDKNGDQLMQTHCRLANGYVVAFNGVLAMGHPIDEELNVCPQTYRLIDALKRCKETLSVTQLDNEQLVIKSGGFRAVIPCVNQSTLVHTAPDPSVGEITDTVKEGFALLNPIVSGSGDTTVEASLLLQNNSMVATNRHVLVEFWHGVNLPDNIAIPKATILAVLKIPYKMVGVGVSDRTVTFHYEGGAWMKTQLYGEKWPEIGRILENGDYTRATDVAPALFDAVDAVSSFSPDGAIHIREGNVCSHRDENVGATYEIQGVPSGLGFGFAHLNLIKNLATTIDMVGADGVTYFFGDRVRGALTQRKV